MRNDNGSLIPLPKKKRSRPKKHFNNYFLAAIILIIIIILSRHFLVSTMAKVRILSMETTSQTTTLDGILIKEEIVVKSPSNGRLRLALPDGERLEMGAKAAEVISSEQDIGEITFDIYTDTTGILCTHLDGYESILAPANIGVLEMPAIEKIDNQPISDGAKVDKGQPVFKIIENLAPVYIYGTMPKSAFAGSYWDGLETLPASWENFDFSIKRGQLNITSDNVEGTFLLAGFPEQIIHHRRVTINVTTRALKGLLAPEQAIVYHDDQPGIYLVVKKKAVWTPVEIEGALSGRVAVSGDGVNEGSSFVSNPVLVREGWLVE
ncbi:MAG: HlyD family efflux transporter periplasmic adaptor subunit [Desulfotomaculaceae bacterium]|nr:HlyD family efflux transporter periplasmic adaptor subunit [Desulfotomaculaceae bacterium]